MIETHFKAYNEIKNKIRYKQMELMKLREDYYSITGVDLSKEKTKGGTPFDMTDQLHLIVEKEKEVSGLTNYLGELRTLHEREINKIPDNNKRTVLKLFYLDSCSIKQIAYCLGVTEGHTKKLKRWAVEEFINKNVEV